MNNTDLRIIKTRRTIQNALIDLLEQKSYEDINVQDIVTAALVNRTTFYRHYASKSELADEMIQSFKAYYAERLAGRSPCGKSTTAATICMPICRRCCNTLFYTTPKHCRCTTAITKPPFLPPLR